MPSPLRVIFIAGKDPISEKAGGHSTYVRAHARAASRGGFEPHLFCLGAATENIETDYGIVHSIGSALVRRLQLRNRSAPIEIPRLASAVASFAATCGNAPVIHSFAFWGSAGVSAATKLSKRGIRTVPLTSMYTTVRHESAGVLRGLDSVHSQFYRWKRRVDHLWISGALGWHEQRGLSGSNLVLVNYDSVRNLIEESYPWVQTRRIQYAPESAFDESVSVPSLRPLSSTGTFNILTLSRHDPRKGLSFFIRALARLNKEEPGFRARIVGPGPLLAAHKQLVSELGIADFVEVAGFVEDPMRELREADVLVLPSFEEGAGALSVLEAFQAGLPVVAADCDGVVEDVRHMDNGLLFDTGDEGSLVRQLKTIRRDTTLRERLARGSRSSFVERFQAAEFVEQLCGTYAEVIG